MTRCYNKSSHKLHYSTVTGSLKKRQSRVSNDDLDDEVSESDNDSDEEVIKALKVVSRLLQHPLHSFLQSYIYSCYSPTYIYLTNFCLSRSLFIAWF